MDYRKEECIIIAKKADETFDPARIQTIQSLDCRCYFIDDIVEVTLMSEFKNKRVIGRICEIGEDDFMLDVSKEFKNETITIKQNDIIKINMYNCPENTLIRKHRK